MGDSITNFGAPASVTVGGEMVFSAFLRRNVVFVSFKIGGARVVKIQVDG